MVIYVIVDNGSTINVYPLKVLAKIKVGKEDLIRFNLAIKSYDDSKRAVDGTSQIVVKTSPIEAMVEFMVLDIPITYGLLLGQHWFYPLRGVPSTLH